MKPMKATTIITTRSKNKDKEWNRLLCYFLLFV